MLAKRRFDQLDVFVGRPDSERGIVAIVGSMPWMVVSLLLFQVGCAGYHIGNQFLFCSDIRTVHVAMFESDSFRRFLGQRLTEAVIKEVELNTPLIITEPELANSFIRGKIVNETKSPLGETINDDVRVLGANWMVEVDWVDRAGVPLMPRQTLIINRDSVFIPEGGQSLSTAQQNIIDKLARDIVNQMERPF